MTLTAPDLFVRALESLPSGTTKGHFEGRKYSVIKTVLCNGKAIKLLAEEDGGNGYISLNFYILKTGAKLFPCEMSHAKVIRFLEGFQTGSDGV